MKFSVATLLTSAVTAIETKLTILHLNDHHSHLSESSSGYVSIRDDDIPASVSASNGNTKDLRAYYGGFPRLVTAINQLHLEASNSGRDVLRLHAGDAITGTTYFTLFEGDADAKLMSHICLDAFAPGNHEFDKGDAGLAKFLKAMKTSAEASTECPQMPAVLGANIVPHDQSSLLANDVPVIESSKVFTLSNGEKIGVIGIDIAKKTMNSSQPDAGTVLLDEKETAQAEIDILTTQGVNKIVLLTHIGFTNDQAWMAHLNGVDVVVGGDSHSLLGDNSTSFFGSIVGEYATEIIQENGSKVCVVQAWDYAKLIGNLEVDFDANGNVVSCGGTPVFPLNPDTVTVRDASPRYNLSPDDASRIMDQLFNLSGGQARPFAEDTASADALAEFTSEVQILSETVVTEVSETVALEEGGWDSGSCDLVAQGFLLNPLSTADIAIQNRGGCRADIEEVSTIIQYDV
jgi:5'-nucleotidase